MGEGEDKKLFKFTADFGFYAYDIDDAFLRLSKHFLGLVLNEASNLIVEGTADIGRGEWRKP